MACVPVRAGLLGTVSLVERKIQHPCKTYKSIQQFNVVCWVAYKSIKKRIRQSKRQHAASQDSGRAFVGGVQNVF